MNACQSVGVCIYPPLGRSVEWGPNEKKKKKKTEFQIFRTKIMDEIGWEERTDRVGALKEL